MKYLILAPHRTDLYWRTDACGYTTDLADVGLYNKDDKFQGLKSDRGDKKIPLSDIKKELEKLSAKLEIDIVRIKWMLKQN